MGATTTEGTGNGSATKSFPAIINGVVKTANIAPNAVVNSDVTDNAVGTSELVALAVTAAKIGALAVTTAKIDALAVTTAKIAANAVTVAKMSVFKSSEQTGTGGAQDIAHGLAVTPGLVMVFPTDLTPGTDGDYAMTEGSHGSTNVVVTVTSGKKYMVVAFA